MNAYEREKLYKERRMRNTKLRVEKIREEHKLLRLSLKFESSPQEEEYISHTDLNSKFHNTPFIIRDEDVCSESYRNK